MSVNKIYFCYVSTNLNYREFSDQKGHNIITSCLRMTYENNHLSILHIVKEEIFVLESNQ